MSSSPIDRRQFLAGAAGVACGPFVPRRRRRPRLRVVGTHVTLREAIREQAARDLDIDLEFLPGGSASVLQLASTRPDQFDVFEQWSNSMRVLWQAGAIQAIDTDRIEAWSEINDLTKTGQLRSGARIGRGDAPHTILFVQDDDSLGECATGRISFLPYVHNVDSFAYLSDVVPEGEPYVEESWSWLLDDRWRGKVALVNEPTIGIFDAALAVEGAGLMKFGDLGALTRSEVDSLFDILIEKRRAGHFYGAWNDVPQSVEFMRKRDTVIQSMFSPGVAELRQEGLAVQYAAPREGYRAWHGVQCISSAARGETLDAAYRFLNWWLSGWAGAQMARQGYYISVPERIREHLTDAEWDYWYEGKPAARDLAGPDGSRAVVAGELRRGGSYVERFSNVAVWNTVMDTYEHSMLGWYEFLTS